MVRRYVPFHSDAVVNVLVYIIGIARVALDSSPLRHLRDVPFAPFVQIDHVCGLNTRMNSIVKAFQAD